MTGRITDQMRRSLENKPPTVRTAGSIESGRLRYEGVLTGVLDVGRKESIEFSLDNLVALTCSCFDAGTVKDGDRASAIPNQARVLQLASSISDALAAYAEHVGNQFLRHREIIGMKAIQAQ